MGHSSYEMGIELREPDALPNAPCAAGIVLAECSKILMQYPWHDERPGSSVERDRADHLLSRLQHRRAVRLFRWLADDPKKTDHSTRHTAAVGQLDYPRLAVETQLKSVELSGFIDINCAPR